MRELKYKCFDNPKSLVDFVNRLPIKQEDIVQITQGIQVVTLWYYA